MERPRIHCWQHSTTAQKRQYCRGAEESDRRPAELAYFPEWATGCFLERAR